MSERPHWRPFDWFALRATGMPLAWAARPNAEPLWSTPLSTDAWRKRIDTARRQLWQRAQTPWFRHALWMSNPGVDGQVDSWEASFLGDKRNSKARQRERTLLNYLTRFCGKNDTTSFFGSISLGRWDLIQPFDEPRPVSDVRGAFLEHWAAQSLLDQLQAEFEAVGAWHDAPRRAPLVVVRGQQVQRHALKPGGSWFTIEATRDGGVAVDLVTRADGTRPRDVLAAQVGAALRVDVNMVQNTIDDLMEAGMLVPCSRLHEGCSDVSTFTTDVLMRQPSGDVRDRWLARTRWLAQQFADFPKGTPAQRKAIFSQLEARVGRWTDGPTRRHAGLMYASRTILHERGDRTGQVTGLPADWAPAIRDAVTPWLDFCLLPVVAQRLKFRAWYQATFDESRRPWGEVVSAFDKAGVRFHLHAPPRARQILAALKTFKTTVRSQVDDHLQAHGADTPFVLDPTLFDATLAPFVDDIAASGRAYAQPDIMVANRPDGTVVPVFAEAHQMPLIEPSLFPASPERHAVWRAQAEAFAALCAPDMPATVCRHRQNFTAWTVDPQQVALELTSLSQVPPERRASLLDLEIEPTEGGFRFSVATFDGTRRFVVPLTAGTRMQMAAAAFPIDFDELGEWLGGGDWRPFWQLPRIRWGPLVVHRRRWRVTSADWAGKKCLPSEAVVRLRQLCGAGLTRLTFTKAPGERKPTLIDWADPCGVELGVWLANRHERLILIEMLPGPEDLWLRGPEGMHTSELRTVFYRR